MYQWDDQIRGYAGLVESIAKQLAGSKRAQAVGAEYDDLVQEGLIAVWKKLEQGVEVVGAEHIRDRMKNYMTWLGRKSPIPYDEMLPLDDNIPTP